MAFTVQTELDICKRYHITFAQLDKATRILDASTGKVFYQVFSQSEVGRLYEVKYNEEHKRLTCTCLAGQEGFGCWHRRAALAATYLHRMLENAAYRVEAGDADTIAQLKKAEHDNRFDRWYAEQERLREVARKLAVGGANPWHLLK